MYIHIGQDTVVRSSELLGFFYIENTSVSNITREFLNDSKKKVIYVSYDMPKSFVVTADRIYISSVSAATLRKRLLNN